MDLLFSLLWTLPLFTTIYFLVSYTKSNLCSKNLPPGPTFLPILGNLLSLLPDTTKPHQTMTELARTYGPIMTLRLGSTTTIVISSSNLAKQVTFKNHLVFSDPFTLEAARAHQHDQFSVGWLKTTSLKWRLLRKIYSSRLFSDKMLQAMQTLRYQKVDELVSYIGECSRASVSIDVGQVIYDASFNIISNTVFNLSPTNDWRVREIKELMDCIIKEIGRPNIVDCYPFLRMIDPQGIRCRLTNFCAKLFKLFDEIIGMRLKSRKDQVNSSGSCKDLLDVLIDIMEDQTDGMSRDDVLHLLLDIFGPGIDTTSKTIEWAMAELLRNPKILSKSQEEIDTIIGKGKRVKESDISKLPYLQAIVKETFRLHPTAPLLLPRKANQDIEIGGFIVPKGARVLVNVWAIGRDPHSWVDPDSFFPERFLGSELDVKGQHFELIPFGAGRKLCPGMPLALRVVPLMLASLVSCFDWKLEDYGDLQENLDMDDMYGITIKKAKALRAFPINRLY